MKTRVNKEKSEEIKKCVINNPGKTKSWYAQELALSTSTIRQAFKEYPELNELNSLSNEKSGDTTAKLKFYYSKFKKVKLKDYKGDKEKLKEIVQITKSFRYHDYDAETTVLLTEKEVRDILYTKPKKVVKKAKLTSNEKKWIDARIESGVFEDLSSLKDAHSLINNFYDIDEFKYIVEEYVKLGIIRKEGNRCVIGKNTRRTESISYDHDYKVISSARSRSYTAMHKSKSHRARFRARQRHMQLDIKMSLKYEANMHLYKYK